MLLSNSYPEPEHFETVVTEISVCQCTGQGGSSCRASRSWHWWAANCSSALVLPHWNPHNCSVWLSLKQINLLHSWWFSSHFISLLSRSGAGALCLPRVMLLCTDCLMFQGRFAKMYSGFQWTVPKGIVGKHPQNPHSFEYLGFLLICLNINECLLLVLWGFFGVFFKEVTEKCNIITYDHFQWNTVQDVKKFSLPFLLMWWNIIGKLRR